MSNYIIEAHGEVRELYSVKADTEDEAREKWERGDADGPWLSEAQGMGIVKIELDDASITRIT